MQRLGATGYDTDKDEVYFSSYEPLFAERRDQPVRLLELGVLRAGSLLLWRDYFEKGTIVGLDVDPVSVDDPTRELVRRLELAMNTRQLDALDEVVAADFVRYCQATPEVNVRSLAEFKEFLGGFDTAFPDNVQTFTHIAADGDLIGFYATYQGTHTGPFGPVPATGKTVRFDFAGMFTVRDGMLAELRVTWDNMTVLGQLGLLPDPA